MFLRDALAGLKSREDREREKEEKAAAAAPSSGILFLDIDGVLNSKVSRAEIDGGFGPDLLANLKAAVSQSNVQIVLSSTWRRSSADRELARRALSTVGLSFDSWTPDLSGASEISPGSGRADEILAWLDAHQASARPWVAIDDLDLLDNPKMKAVHFVRTMDAVGLTPANAEEVRLQLSQQRGDGSCATLSFATTLAEDEAHLAPYDESLQEILSRECATSDEPALPVELLPSLLLGDRFAAADVSALKARGVTHVLNAAGPDGRARRELGAQRAMLSAVGIKYLEIAAVDSLRYDMAQHVDAASRFMGAVEAEGGKCLVYCMAGINRSGFLAIAQLMLGASKPLLEALEAGKTARGVVLLNRAFQLQLLRFACARGLLGPPPLSAMASVK